MWRQWDDPELLLRGMLLISLLGSAVSFAIALPHLASYLH